MTFGLELYISRRGENVNKNLVVKSNELIEARYNLTLMEEIN